MERCLDFLDNLNTWQRGLEYDNITLDEAINEAMDSESKILSLQKQINELGHENTMLKSRLSVIVASNKIKEMEYNEYVY
tara:strand:- start:88 stop:327 length:240 start_codon:yes stop_codon:yes gene_type:complete